MTTVASGFVSFSPALLHAKSRRPFPNSQIRSTALPIVSASLSHIEANTTTTTNLYSNFSQTRTNSISMMLHNISLADLDPGTAKLAIGILGPALSAFGFLFIVRIVMSWYPKLPVEKFPYVLAYAPTEPILVQTRKVIPPLAGVDVTPVVWFGLLSFLSEILVGPQGLLVLVSQQQTGLLVVHNVPISLTYMIAWVLTLRYTDQDCCLKPVEFSCHNKKIDEKVIDKQMEEPKSRLRIAIYVENGHRMRKLTKLNDKEK